jgi:peroxiredoxin
MPSVQRVHNDFKNNGNVVVLMISVDSSRAPVDAYLAENGYAMPVVLDANIQVASKFGVLGTPTTFIINRQGNIVASGFGPVDFDKPVFRKYLQALIAEPTLPAPP